MLAEFGQYYQYIDSQFCDCERTCSGTWNWEMVQQGDSLRLSVKGSLWISNEFGAMAQVQSGRTHNKAGYNRVFAPTPKPIFLSRPQPSTQIHVYKMHAYMIHTNEIHAYETHTYEMHAP